MCVGLGHGEFTGRSSLVAYRSMGGTIVVLGLKGVMNHNLHLVVLVVLQGDMRVFHLGVIGWNLLTPLLSEWLGTSSLLSMLTPVLSSFLTLILDFYFVGGRPEELLHDRLRLL
jgi:hypothetical protein